MKSIKLYYIIFGLLFLSACAPVSPFSTPVATQPQAQPAALLSTATSEPLLPAGWEMHTNQQCQYMISYPSEMQAIDQDPYSQSFAFELPNPDEGARNFIYVSVIAPEIQNLVKAGIYNHEVYNYDPVGADILMNMQVGESKAVRDFPNAETGFTYQRQPDVMIGGQAAQAYENTEPWEFPVGTKEIRYYSSLDGCTYLIGGYVDTTGADQPGAITEELFQQIMATVQLMP